MKNNLKTGDMVRVRVYGTDGKAIKTNNFDEVFTVCEKNGKLGIDWTEDFAPFETFASNVAFENVETGEKFHFSNIKNNLVKENKEELIND